ncbi:MAG: type II toxin-antitoxin system RelE/ParE family toxin [Gammaproteobacteria bacterium]
MIRSFADSGTEDVFEGRNSRDARRACPRNLWRSVARKLDLLDSADSLEDLKVPPGNRLEALTANRRGQFSIRINQQYRICFVWSAEGPEGVEIVDYHR